MNQLALKFPGAEVIDEKNFDAAGSLTLNTATPADILNDIMPFVFVVAGLILLFMLVFGGFTIFISAGNPEKVKQGSGMITNALIGFLIIFCAYWIIELLQFTFGIQVL